MNQSLPFSSVVKEDNNSLNFSANNNNNTLNKQSNISSAHSSRVLHDTNNIMASKCVNSNNCITQTSEAIELNNLVKKRADLSNIPEAGSGAIALWRKRLIKLTGKLIMQKQ